MADHYTRSTILVTDDSLVTLLLVREFLEDEGFIVLTAQNGNEAIKMATEFQPDLALLDVTMPGIDGYETCTILKSTSATADIPVIFISANTAQLNKIQAFECGAVDYVIKPIEFIELKERIKTHLKISKLQKDLLQANTNLEQQIKKRTQQLNESEAKFRTIAESAVFGVFIFSDRVLYANESFCRMVKDSYDAILKLPLSEFREIFYPEDIPIILAEMQKKTDGNMDYVSHYECRLFDKFKNIIWVEIYSKLIFLNGEKVTFSTFLDITDKKRAEQELRNAQARFFNVLEMLPSFVCLLKEDKTIVYANQKFKSIFNEENPEGKYCHYIIHCKGDACVNCHTQDVFCTMQNQEREWKNPETGKDYIISTHHMIDVDGSSRALKFGFDVSDLKKAELEILKVQQQLQEHKLLSAVVETEEKERQKFAQELHDGLGPLLSTGKIYIHNIKSAKDEKLKEISIEKIFEIFDESLASIKEISNNISPHILKNFGLTVAVETFIDKCKPAAKAIIFLKSDIQSRMPDIIEITAYRFITEMINNSLKYSFADKIEINIFINSSQLCVEYSDNGIGFEMESQQFKKSGYGIVNIENRVKTMFGIFNYYSKPGEGIKANIVLPL